MILRFSSRAQNNGMRVYGKSCSLRLIYTLGKQRFNEKICLIKTLPDKEAFECE